MPALGNGVGKSATTAARNPRGSLDALLHSMLQTSPNVSDLIFSPGRPPQVEVRGQLLPCNGEGAGFPQDPSDAKSVGGMFFYGVPGGTPYVPAQQPIHWGHSDVCWLQNYSVPGSCK